MKIVCNRLIMNSVEIQQDIKNKIYLFVFKTLKPTYLKKESL